MKKSVDITDWNEARGLAKPRTPDLKLLNNYLEEVRMQVTESYRKLHLYRIGTRERSNSLLSCINDNRTRQDVSKPPL